MDAETIQLSDAYWAAKDRHATTSRTTGGVTVLITTKPPSPDDTDTSVTALRISELSWRSAFRGGGCE